MKLLIVDDELDLCCLLKEHFEEHFDGEVLTATTPREALRLLEQLQPDGMLLDINLRSRLNGFEVLSRASEISPATKVIMGYRRQRFRERRTSADARRGGLHHQTIHGGVSRRNGGQQNSHAFDVRVRLRPAYDRTRYEVKAEEVGRIDATAKQ